MMMARVRRFFSGEAPLWLYGLLIVTIIVLRQPLALLEPQFWAEDGMFWYADAYGTGWPSLFKPHTGYLQSLSRLTAIVAVQFPLVWGPFLFAAVALIVQALPPVFLLSSRFDDVVPSRVARLALAAFYVAIPGAWEVHVNLTNSQWYLAVLGFLVVCSGRPAGVLAWAFDVTVLVVGGLSGPFSIFLAPLAWLHFLQGGGRHVAIRAMVVSGAAALQIASLLLVARLAPPLGASISLFAQIVSNQVVLAAEVGERLTREIIAWPPWTGWGFPLVVMFGAGLLVAIAFVRGPNIFRLFVLLAGMQAGAALLRPAGPPDVPQWPVMIQPGYGGRYFLLAMLAWLASLVVLLASPWRAVRVVAGLAVALCLVGVVSDWSPRVTRQEGFYPMARAFDAAPAGTTMTFPINPTGWTMTLTRR